jgi:tripartite-type tricarboxylate transporter receptor subunit TctC
LLSYHRIIVLFIDHGLCYRRLTDVPDRSPKTKPREGGAAVTLCRRRFLHVAAGAAALPALSSRVGAQPHSLPPIRIIFPFAAGGSGDGLARLIAVRMQAALNRTVIVENRTGGAGRLAVAAVKNAAPDGGTLLITPIAPMAVYQHVYKGLEYDPIRDFVALSQLATFDFAVAVGAQIPATSLHELVAWVKADPSRAAFGSPAAGALPHFFGILFGRAAGLELRHVAYRGSAATLGDLTAGHVPMVFTTISDLVELHKAQRVRILATSGRERSPFVPEVPTFREAGVDIEGTSWFGAFAPAKTPPDVVDRYSEIMAAAVRVPEIKERLMAYGLQPTGTSAAELSAIQKADSARWAQAVALSGFTMD